LSFFDILKNTQLFFERKQSTVLRTSWCLLVSVSVDVCLLELTPVRSYLSTLLTHNPSNFQTLQTFKHGTQNTEHGTQNTEHRTQNTERYLPVDGFVHNPVLSNNEAVTKINSLSYSCCRSLLLPQRGTLSSNIQTLHSRNAFYICPSSYI